MYKFRIYLRSGETMDVVAPDFSTAIDKTRTEHRDCIIDDVKLCLGNKLLDLFG